MVKGFFFIFFFVVDLATTFTMHICVVFNFSNRRFAMVVGANIHVPPHRGRHSATGHIAVVTRLFGTVYSISRSSRWR